jgi:hypothetical protein
MVKCQFCGEQSIGYVRVFVKRKKVGSLPACFKHCLIAQGFISLGQESVRSFLAGVYPIKKGSIPRLKVSLEK